jgi:DNA-binding transcriptional LysR family regulator
MSTPAPLQYSLRQLRYFVVTGEVLSFTVAAKLLRIAQPSISAAMADLESSFGVQLFVRRHAHGLSLTEAGRDILGKARDLLKHAEEFQAAAALNTSVTGTISLGCMVSLAPLLYPGSSADFSRRIPEFALKRRKRIRRSYCRICGTAR